MSKILKVERQKSYKNPTQKSLFISKSLSNIVYIDLVVYYKLYSIETDGSF